MKVLSLLAGMLVSMLSIQAQHRQTVLIHFDYPHANPQEILTVDAAFSEGPFIAFSLVWPGKNSGEWLVEATLESGAQERYTLHPDAHHADPRRFVSQLAFLPKETRWVRLVFFSSENEGAPAWVEAHLFNPSHTRLISGEDRPLAETSRACPCPLPPYLSRSEWCPDGSCPTNPSPTFTVVTHLIVHHSAGPNSSSDWPAVVRAIWDFHVNVNGWSDIGYNWLIDPLGNLYEGRPDNVLGAHFCGTNGGTMGVCMLGNYQETDPSGAALLKLEELLAWKTCNAGLDPLGIAYHPSSGLELYTISGHRDGCSTECPGDHLYPLLPQLRQSVQNRILNLCSQTSAPAAPTQLEALLLDLEHVRLNWSDNADNETSYILERSANEPNSYTQLATLPQNTTTYDDLTVMPNTGYYYRVRAANDNIFSDYSNEAFVFTSFSADINPSVNKELVVFPNPATTELIVQVRSPGFSEGKIQLYDLKGMLLFERTLSKGPLHIDVSAWPAGFYLLKVSSRSGALFRKVMLW